MRSLLLRLARILLRLTPAFIQILKACSSAEYFRYSRQQCLLPLSRNGSQGPFKALSLAIALAFAPVLWAGFTSLPMNWQFHSIDLPDINNTRAIIGEYEGAVLMNLSPDPAVVDHQQLFFPVLIDPVNKKYAPLISLWPLQWLDTTRPLKEQLSAAQLADMQGKSALAYSLQGNIVSGFYENMTGKGEDRKVTAWGAVGFSIPSDEHPVTYVGLPRPRDSQSSDIIMALFSSQDGETAFGVADHYYQLSPRKRQFVSALTEQDSHSRRSDHKKSYKNARHKSSQSVNEGKGQQISQPAATDYVKYYFWNRTAHSSSQDIRVDFSSDPENRRYAGEGNGNAGGSIHITGREDRSRESRAPQ